MKITLTLPPGELDVQAPASTPRSGRTGRSTHSKIADKTPTRVLKVDKSRAGGEEVEIDVHENELVEIELDNEIKLWTSAGQFAEDTARASRTSDGRIRIPADLPGGDQSRGAVRIGIKVLRFFGYDVEQELGRAAAMGLIKQIEGGETEFFRVDRPSITPYQPVSPASIASEKPILVLLHGTGSSTKGSFSALEQKIPDAAEPAWETLKRRYAERTYTLEHRSLSESPVDNALKIVDSLPDGADLHLLTYSRGGLIGELLARAGRQDQDGNPVAPFDDDDVAMFNAWSAKRLDGVDEDDREAVTKERREEAKNLKRLSDLMVEKKIKVSRFVRVACPAAGTTLASGRIDRYLSVALNVLEKIPGLKDSDVFSITAGVLEALVATRTDPRLVPGLEAMMPTSPLMVVLNRTDVTIAGDLSVIAGDIEPEGFFKRLAVWGADTFYDGDHDFVVDTWSMLGGAVRAEDIRYVFDQGPGVNHFTYFTNAKTMARTLAALDGDHSGFETYTEGKELVARGLLSKGFDPERDNKHTETEAPILFVLPGIMGTELELHSKLEEPKTLWLDPIQIAQGALSTVGDFTQPIEPGAPLRMSYAKVMHHMTQTHHVVPFGYDWRQSLIHAAAELDKAVTEKLDAFPDQPIRFLAHSMGGLVVRTMIANHRATWDRVKARNGARFVMLGTPNGGSHSIVERMVGLSSIVRMLHNLDMANSKRELLAIVRQMPGVLDLLPAEGNWFQASTWQTLHDVYPGDWEVPSQTLLDDSRKVRDLLDDPAKSMDPDISLYVAGWAKATPINVKGKPDAWFWQRKVEVDYTNAGDGQVTWKTGTLGEGRTWYTTSAHDVLADEAKNFQGYTDLLQNGTTSFLSTEPVVSISRGGASGDDTVDVEPRGEPILDMRLFTKLPMGGSLDGELSPTREPFAHVSIEHGNLAFCKRVVTVGHYADEALVGAEGFINYKLDNALSQRRTLGLYPGALETSEAIFQYGESAEYFPGALVVGLGEIGKLTKEDLVRTLTHGFLDYAFRCRERRRNGRSEDLNDQHSVTDSAKTEETGSAEPANGAAPPAAPAPAKPEPLELATLLIGHIESRLTLNASVEALLEALVRCNRNLPPEDRIQDLRIVELYDDAAIAAASMLQRIQKSGKYDGALTIDPILREGGGPRQAIDSADERDYYTRIEIVSEGDESLKFTVFGDSSVATEAPKLIDKRAIDIILRDLTKGTASSREDAQLLFELMLPQDLKRSSRDRRNLMLILDEASAAYPWELLDDANSGFPEPLAVMGQITRQLRQHRADVEIAETQLSEALVVGDPVSPMPALPGAQSEANRVASVLKAGTSLNVTKLIKPQGIDVLRALVRGENKVVHLAGHGEFLDDDASEDERKLASTGMVLGPDMRLDSSHVMSIRRPPEFVFLNCCHLGGIAQASLSEAARLNRYRLAANLAVAFMRRGTRAVIAAGWEVDDLAAKAFADTFYQSFTTQGASFGAAILAGRQAAHNAAPGRNTWGAYQCYGDPEYSLATSGPARRKQVDNDPFVSQRQAIRAMTNISEDASSESALNLPRLKRRLEEAEKRIDESWKQDAELNTAIAVAASDIGDFEKAIEHYTIAINQPGSQATIDAIEQRANLRARLAADRVLNASRDNLGAERRRGQSEVAQSVKELKGLIDFVEDSAGSDPNPNKAVLIERQRLLGSAYRRKSIVNSFKDLLNMGEHYWLALQASLDPTGPDAFHADSAVNVHFSVYVLTLCANEVKYSESNRTECRTMVAKIKKDLPDLKTIASACRARIKDKNDFWDLAMLGDVTLCQALMADQLTQRLDDVTSAYRNAWRYGGRQRHFMSIIETHRFILDVLDGLRSNTGDLQHRPDTMTALERLIDRLEEMSTPN